MSKFGEPWGRFVHDHSDLGFYDVGIKTHDDTIVNRTYELADLEAMDRNIAVLSRATACVNACEGIDNPEAVKEMRKVLKDLEAIHAAAYHGDPVFANQGQALDGYSELYNYNGVAENAIAVLRKVRGEDE